MLDTNGMVAKLMVAVAADEVSLTIAMLVTATAMLDGDVYSVVLEVAAAPRYKVIDVSDTILIPSRLSHLLTICNLHRQLGKE
jgi:hypothetical protein